MGIADLLKLENDVLRVALHCPSASIVELIDKVSGAPHIAVREPELAQPDLPGLGVYEIEPFIRPVECELRENAAYFAAKSGDLEYAKSVKLEKGAVAVGVRVVNRGAPRDVRIRSLAYVACGEGGYFARSRGALYSCAYFVKFGFEEPTPYSFSSVGVKPPTSGFPFKRHEFVDRYFPELKWAAFVDRSKRVGLALLVEGDAYGVIEDQFFYLELDVVSRRRLGPGEAMELRYKIIPFSGLQRVDHVGADLIAGVETPSVVKPGEAVRGRLALYPLTPLRASLSGRIEEPKFMSVLGRRGYTIDRVAPDHRAVPLAVRPGVLEAEPFKAAYAELESPPLDWTMDYTIYAMPRVVTEINGVGIKRAFSIDPDYAAAVELLRRRKPWLRPDDEFLNEAVDGFYQERAAADHVYELAVDPLSYRPGLLAGVRRLEGKALEVLNAFLGGAERRGERWYVYNIITTGDAARALRAAASYRFLGDREELRAALEILEKAVELYERGELIHFFNGLQGGGGAGGMFQLALAFDLLEDVMSEELKRRLLLMFRWAQRELMKITNAWAGNWETMEALALAALSAKFDFSSSPLGLARAEAVFRSSLNYFYDDGAWPEESAVYHLAALYEIVQGAEILRKAGVDLYSISRGGRPVIKSAVEWLWQIMTPYYRIPAIEDSGDDVPGADVFITAGVRYGDPSLIRLGLELLKRGARVESLLTPLALAEALAAAASTSPPPARPSVLALDPSGRFVVRSGESEDSAYFILDYGPHGAWHGHPDKLSFELHAFGEPLAVDSGSAHYYGAKHWTWNRRSIAHNTVTLGDRDQVETRGRLLELRQEGDAVYAAFEAETYPGVRHVRRIYTPDRYAYVIRDEIRGDGVFRWNLNLMGGVAEEGEARGAYFYKLASPGGRRYVVLLPKRANVGQGWRKEEVRTIYMYYEQEVKGEGEMWGILSAREEDVGRLLGLLRTAP